MARHDTGDNRIVNRRVVRDIVTNDAAVLSPRQYSETRQAVDKILAGKQEIGHGFPLR
jgi:hypothetical protein